MQAAFALPTDLFGQRSLPIPAFRALRMVDVLRAKRARVHMVEWLRWPTDLSAQEARDGVTLERLMRPVPPGGALARVQFLRDLTRDVAWALEQAKPEGIVVQDGELLTAAAQAAGRLRVPLFYDSQEHWPGMVREEHPLEALAYDLLERRAARRITHVYTVSEPIAARFRRIGVPVSLVFNSRDTADILPHVVPREEAKRALGLPEDSFVLGFSGSITPDSGLEQAVEALRDLPPEARLVVIGGPQEELARIGGLAEQRGVRDRTLLLPGRSPAESVRVGCAFDVGLLALAGRGLNYAYRAPYKLFEYMGLGLPFIVSDYPEMRRVAVEDARCAMSVPPGDAPALADAARKLREAPGLREELAANARAAFASRYSGERQKETLRASHPFWR
ncbi:MAG: glycosyltransferase [Halobacteriales archaeon]|nr:glycosyltransferase [Halobacteriales archaeon]